jgi:lysyl-tRNA synthetase, class II
MELTETMIATVTQEVVSSLSVTFGDHEIDLAVPWRRVSVRDALLEHTGIDLESNPSREDLLAVARQHRIDVAGDATVGKLLDELVSRCVEPLLIQPTFLYDFPIEFPGNLLARSREDNPRITERFEAYMGGMEFLNGFTELNDPREQRERMEAATRLRGEEHQEIDRDYVRALEQGMPPTGGVGIGLDRLMMIVTGAQQIRETILFPLLRQHEDVDAEP